MYTDFLVYFDVKEAKIKTDESKERAQKDWVKLYTDICYKNKVNPMEIIKDADTNRNNELELKELEAVVKLYIKSPAIDYKELQHIIDCFDTNNDGVCTVQEYKDAILKYGQKNGLLELSDEEKKDFVMFVKKGCNDNNASLKTAISECEFNEKFELSVQSITRQIKLASKMTQAESKKLFDFITNNPEALSVTAEQIFKFYDEYLAEDPDIRLELKLVLAKKESESSPSILNYLKVELSMDPEGDILLKEFIKTMSDCLEIQKSSSEFIYKQITSFNNKNAQPRLVDFYCLLLNERDHDKVSNEQLDPNAVFAKLSAFIKNKYKNSKNALADLGAEYNFDFSAGGSDSELHVYEFEEIFVDLNEVVTAREALCLFEDIKAKYKVKGNAITGENFYDYFQNKIKPTPVPKPILEPKKVEPPKEDKKIVPQKVKEIVEEQEPKEDNVFARIEKSRNVFLAESFNFIEKSIIIKPTKIAKILEDMYSQNKLSMQEYEQIGNAILNGKDSLKFKEFFGSINKLTSYKCNESKFANQLKDLIKNAVNSDLNFEFEPDKSYLNIILPLANNKCLKYELINAFYNNAEMFKRFAQDCINKRPRPDDNKKSTNNNDQITVESEETKDPNKESKPKADIGKLNIFGNLGFIEENKEESQHEKSKAEILLDKISHNLKDDLHFSKSRAQNDSGFVDEKDKEEFNKLMNGFIKNFSEITKIDCVIKSIDATLDFLTKHNGSKFFLDCREEHKTENIDVLDLWNDTKKWNNLKFSTDYERYVCVFVKYDAKLYATNIKQLEKFIGSINKKNKEAKANDIVKILTKVLKDLAEAAEITSDLNKTINLSYNVKMKDGMKIHKGGAEELIQDIKKYVSNADNKKKLYEAFDKYQDSQKEISIGQLKQILDANEIANTKQQREYLFKIMDSDNDVMVSVNEFKNFISKYDSNAPLVTNIFNKEGKKNKFELFQNLMDVKISLNDEDYFLHDTFTTIMNSDYAALTRLEQLVSVLKPGEKFFDTEFGPKNANDEIGNKMSLYSDGNAPPGYIKPEQICWIRPEEFTGGKKYAFTNDEASSNEVIQGALGDCWFISALSVLATRDDLLEGGLSKYKITKDFVVTPKIAQEMTEGVYPPIFKSYEKYGVYVFKFFKNFSWRYVIIDDRIPCYKSNKTPVFGRCKDITELWVPLIEKAYAKLHHCYASLVSGFIDDGLSELTGFVAEKINMHDNKGIFPNKKLGTKETFWKYLLDRREELSMLGCARKDETVEGEVIIDGEKTGILSRHAYSLLDIFELKNSKTKEVYQLLRVRNPWGKTEWVGDWSDTSDEIETHRDLLQKYVDNLEEDEKFEIGAEDGTFFINYQDWSQIYNKLYVTIDFPDNWSGVRFTDKWDEKCAGGLPMPCNDKTSKSWATNPQYLINIKEIDEVEFFISLGQHDGRIVRGSVFPYAELIHPVNLIIYPSSNGQALTSFNQKEAKPEWISAVVEHKEVSLRVKLKKGSYIVVPSTREADSKGEYFLSIYFSADLFDVEIKHLKKPEVKGIEIQEEAEDESITDIKLKIIQARIGALATN